MPGPHRRQTPAVSRNKRIRVLPSRVKIDRIGAGRGKHSMAVSVIKWGRRGAFWGVLIALLGLLSAGPAFAVGGIFQWILILTLGPLYPVVGLAAFLGFPIGNWPPLLRLLFVFAIPVFYGWLGRLIARAMARRRIGENTF